MEHWLVRLVGRLEQRSRRFWLVVGLALIPILGILDYLMGYELGLSLFYLLPISLVAWFVGRNLGLTAALAGAITWLIADIASGHPYLLPGVPYWNAAIRLGIFTIVALLLSVLKGALERERRLSRTDYLTGAVNGRYFLELLQREIDRSRRYQHPFTVAYMDLDDFKLVNDRWGHATGDQLICVVVRSIQDQLRQQDVIGRIGGDEFMLLLPETDQDAAQVVITRIHHHVLADMQQHAWPVTCSIGVVTYRAAPDTADQVIQAADGVMYAVKQSDKNGVRYTTCD
ncbi:MAG: diguanylate cyclase [Chloroflexi bacterium]|nr:diguanylate cyclase [Chloroflexota bacterium]MBU1879362.1 diguanylate cyclase [Chloroflexota bacterium]